MTNPDLVQQAQEVWDMDEDQLYHFLGMNSLGTKDIAESVDSMNMLMSAAANTDGALAKKILNKHLRIKGEALFKHAWESVKGIVCTIYEEQISIGGKDLVAYLVAVIVAAGALTNALAVVVITIAVKKGLDKLCKVPKH